MLVKVFVLGRPGSGKTTAIRHLSMLARKHERTMVHIDDYSILHAMFKEDSQERFFKPAAHNGFDVIDLSVLDTALQKLEKQVEVCIQDYSHREGIIAIEFARDNYQRIFKQFTPSFLQNAYFLYLECSLEVCIERIQKRATRFHHLRDCQFVSEHIMRSYYAQENLAYMQDHFFKDYQIAKEVKAFNNSDYSTEKLLKDINTFAAQIFEQEHIGPLAVSIT